MFNYSFEHKLKLVSDTPSFLLKNWAILGIFGNIGTFGDIVTEINFLIKNQKRVGVGNEVII